MKTSSSNNIPVHQQDSELQCAFSPSSAMGPAQGILAGGEVCVLQDLAQEEPSVPSTTHPVGIGITHGRACSRAWPGTTPAKVD